MDTEAVLQVAHKIEEVIDSKIEDADNLDEDEIQRIRRERIDQLKTMRQRQEVWARKGHGSYNEIYNAHEFFKVCKENERVIVHFYRGSTERCQIMHSHLEKIALKHIETYFGRVNVESVIGLAEHFNIVMIPTVMLVEGGKTLHSLIGFDELGGSDHFSTQQLVQYLGDRGIINLNGMFASDQTNF